ncbi:MAG TPA: chromosomal replication initiator protein DnaA, partial [Pirellulales bacterium]|nr:chromosomal replication initiator protein DnaA [Pirellulales bacterium]
MTKSDREIVSALQLALAEKVGSDRYELWFGGRTRLSLADGGLTVSVPDRFFQDWLRKNFRHELEASCVAALGKPLPIFFEIDSQLAVVANAAPKKQAALSAQPAAPAATRPDPDGGQPPPRRFASLETFVLGGGNRLAHLAAQTVAQRLGSTNPLVLHGPTGVGKTHLLEGIWIAAKKSRPSLHAVYLSAEQFTTYYVDAVRGSGLPSFRRKYRGLDLLLIDDVQFFANKKATLGELLHTIDALIRDGRQIVFAADRLPAQLPGLGAELGARLQGGLVCGIDPPDYETRLGIVRQMASRLDTEVPHDVQVFVAAQLTTHARALAGALNRLHAHSQAHDTPVTLAMAEQCLADMLPSYGRGVRLADIEQAVCDVFGLEPKTLRSTAKGKLVDHPRMLAMWLARKHTRAALSEIGQYFGRRSHTTVISAQKRVNRWMADGAPLAVS